MNERCTPRWVLSVVLASAAHLAGEPGQAEVTFLGPTPYFSAEDSLFDLSGLGETFFLEDFEDGELNTPGIFDPAAPDVSSFVASPGLMTDSVDADDGVMDGLGQNGHSLVSARGLVQPIDPPISTSYIWLQFNEQTLRGWPTAFGFAWTDGGQPSLVTLRIFDTELNEIARAEFDGIGDSMQTGETEEDRFIGVFSDEPIVGVVISSRHRGQTARFEIDHVQYGRFIPEPSGIAITIVVTLAAVRWYAPICPFTARRSP